MERVKELFYANTPEKFEEAISILKNLQITDDNQQVIRQFVEEMQNPNPPPGMSQEVLDMIRYVVCVYFFMNFKKTDFNIISNLYENSPPNYGPLFCLVNRDNWIELTKAFCESLDDSNNSRYYCDNLQGYLHFTKDTIRPTNTPTIIEAILKSNFKSLPIKAYYLIHSFLVAARNIHENTSIYQRLFDLIFKSKISYPLILVINFLSVNSQLFLNDEKKILDIFNELYDLRFRYDITCPRYPEFLKFIFDQMKNFFSNNPESLVKWIAYIANRQLNSFFKQNSQIKIYPVISHNQNPEFIVKNPPAAIYYMNALILAISNGIRDLILQKGYCLNFPDIGNTNNGYITYTEQPHNLNPTSELDYELQTSYNPFIINIEDSHEINLTYLPELEHSLDKINQSIFILCELIKKSDNSLEIIHIMILLMMHILIASSRAAFQLLITNIHELRNKQGIMLKRQEDIKRQIKKFYDECSKEGCLQLRYEDIATYLVDAIMKGNHSYRLVQDLEIIFNKNDLIKVIERMFIICYMKIYAASSYNSEDYLRSVEQVFLFICRLAEGLTIKKNEYFGKILEYSENKFIQALCKLARSSINLDSIYHIIFRYYKALEFHADKQRAPEPQKLQQLDFDLARSNSMNSYASAKILFIKSLSNPDLKEDMIAKIAPVIESGLNSDDKDIVKTATLILTKNFHLIQDFETKHRLFASLLDSVSKLDNEEDQKIVANFIAEQGFNFMHEHPYHPNEPNMFIQETTIDLNLLLNSLCTMRINAALAPSAKSFIAKAAEEIMLNYESEESLMKSILSKFHYICTDLCRFKNMHNSVMKLYEDLNSHFAKILINGGSDIYFLTLISASSTLMSYIEHFALNQAYKFLTLLKQENVNQNIIRNMIQHIGTYYTSDEAFCFINACSAIKKVFPQSLNFQDLILLTNAIKTSPKKSKIGINIYGKIIKATLETIPDREREQFLNFAINVEISEIMTQWKLIKNLPYAKMHIRTEKINLSQTEELFRRLYKLCCCLICGCDNFDELKRHLYDVLLSLALAQKQPNGKKPIFYLYAFYMLYTCFKLGPFKTLQDIDEKFKQSNLYSQNTINEDIEKFKRICSADLFEDNKYIDILPKILSKLSSETDPKTIQEILKSKVFNRETFTREKIQVVVKQSDIMITIVERIAQLNADPNVPYSLLKHLALDFVCYYAEKTCEILHHRINAYDDSCTKLVAVFNYWILNAPDEKLLHCYLDFIRHNYDKFIEHPTLLSILETVSDDRRIARNPKLKEVSRELFNKYINHYRDENPLRIYHAAICLQISGTAYVNSFLVEPTFEDLIEISKIYDMPMIRNSEISVLFELNYNNIPLQKRIELLSKINSSWDSIPWRSMIIPFVRILKMPQIPPDLVADLAKTASPHLSLDNQYAVPAALLITKFLQIKVDVPSDIYARLLNLLPDLFSSIEDEVVNYAFDIAFILNKIDLLPDEMWIEISALLISTHLSVKQAMEEMSFFDRIRKFLNLKTHLLNPVPFVIHRAVQTAFLNKFCMNSDDDYKRISSEIDLLKEIPALQRCVPFTIKSILAKAEHLNVNLILRLSKDLKPGFNITQKEYEDFIRANIIKIFTDIRNVNKEKKENASNNKNNANLNNNNTNMINMLKHAIQGFQAPADPNCFAELTQFLVEGLNPPLLIHVTTVFLVNKKCEIDPKYYRAILDMDKALTQTFQVFDLSWFSNFVKAAINIDGMVQQLIDKYTKTKPLEKLEPFDVLCLIELFDSSNLDIEKLPLIWNRYKESSHSPQTFFNLVTKVAQMIPENQKKYTKILAEIAAQDQKTAELFVNQSVLNIAAKTNATMREVIFQEIARLTMIYNLNIPAITVSESIKFKSSASMQLLITYAAQATPDSRVVCLTRCQEFCGETVNARIENLTANLPHFFWCDKYLVLLVMIVMPQEFPFWRQIVSIAPVLDKYAAISIAKYVFVQCINAGANFAHDLLRIVSLSVQSQFKHMNVLESIMQAIIATELDVGVDLAFKAAKKTGDFTIVLSSFETDDQTVPSIKMVMPHEINDFVFAKYKDQFDALGPQCTAAATQYLLSNFEESANLFNSLSWSVETGNVVQLFMQAAERLTMRPGDNIADYMLRIMGENNFTVAALQELFNKDGENHKPVDEMRRENIQFLLNRKTAPSILNSERFVLMHNIFNEYTSRLHPDKIPQCFSQFNSAFYNIYQEAGKLVAQQPSNQVIETPSSDEKLISIPRDCESLFKSIVGENRYGQLVVTVNQIRHVLTQDDEQTLIKSPEASRIWGSFCAAIFEMGMDDESIFKQSLQAYLYYLKVSHPHSQTSKRIEAKSRVVLFLYACIDDLSDKFYQILREQFISDKISVLSNELDLWENQYAKIQKTSRINSQESKNKQTKLYEHKLQQIKEFVTFLYHDFSDILQQQPAFKFARAAVNAMTEGRLDPDTLTLRVARSEHEEQLCEEARNCLAGKDIRKYLEKCTEFLKHLSRANEILPVALPAKIRGTDAADINRLTDNMYYDGGMLIIQYIDSNGCKKDLLIHEAQSEYSQHDITISILLGAINSIYNACYVTAIRGMHVGTNTTYELPSDSGNTITMTIMNGRYTRLSNVLNINDTSDEAAEAARNYAMSIATSKDDLIKKRASFMRSFASINAVNEMLEFDHRGLFICPENATFFAERSRMLLHTPENFAPKLPRTLTEFFGPFSQNVVSIGTAAAETALRDSNVQITAVLDTALNGLYSEIFKTNGQRLKQLFERRRTIIDELLASSPPLRTSDPSSPAEFEWLDKIY